MPVNDKTSYFKNEHFSIILSRENAVKKHLTFAPSEHYFLVIGNTDASIDIQTEAHSINCFSMVLVSAENGFSLSCCTENMYSIIISSKTANALNEFLNLSVLKEGIVIAENMTVSDKKNIIKKSDDILKLKDKATYELECKKLLFDIITTYFTKNRPIRVVEEKAPVWLLEVCEQIKQNKGFTKGVKYMYELSHKTPEHFSRCMKKYLNTTPTEFINSLKMKNAASLLLETDQTVMDICFECGYQNISWFNTLFKETFSMSPNEYRKLYRNK